MCAKKMELKKIQKEHKRDPEIATLQVVLEMKRKQENAPAIVVVISLFFTFKTREIVIRQKCGLVHESIY